MDLDMRVVSNSEENLRSICPLCLKRAQGEDDDELRGFS